MGMVKGLYNEEIQAMEERIQDLESQSAYEGAYIEPLETELDEIAYAIDGLGKAFHAVSGRIAGSIARAQGMRDGRWKGWALAKWRKGTLKPWKGSLTHKDGVTMS